MSKLPRNGITAAAHHLRAILGEYNLQHPSDPLAPARIVRGDGRNPVDYVFLSVDPGITQEPRPDLLELTTTYDLRAKWKVGKGPDRTRRVHFQVDSFAQAKAFQPKLCDHLNGIGCSYQCSFVSKAMKRITFDLLDHASVNHLLDNPPIIDHQTLYPSTPRYIQPVYGLEVAILGVKDVMRVAPVIDHYTHSTYGDVIAASRLSLNGDAYCVVFKTWGQTSRFLSDPFTAFESGFGVFHSVSPAVPALLYVLNSNGLPFSGRPEASTSNAFLRQHAQFDMLQHNVDTGARAFDSLAGQQEHLSQQLQDNAQRTAASIAGLLSVMSGSARLQAATSRLDALQSDHFTSQMLLAFAPSDRTPAIIQHLQCLDSDISAQRTAVTDAQDSLSATERLLPVFALPSLQALTARAAQHPRTRALDDPDALTHSDTRRLRARTDGGFCPPRDDSPLQVDSVTCLPSSLLFVHSCSFPLGSLAPLPSFFPFLFSLVPKFSSSFSFLLFFLFVCFISSSVPVIARRKGQNGALGLCIDMMVANRKVGTAETLPGARRRRA